MSIYFKTEKRKTETRDETCFIFQPKIMEYLLSSVFFVLPKILDKFRTWKHFAGKVNYFEKKRH